MNSANRQRLALVGPSLKIYQLPLHFDLSFLVSALSSFHLAPYSISLATTEEKDNMLTQIRALTPVFSEVLAYSPLLPSYTLSLFRPLP
jgi:hypothetical protein